MVKTSVDTEFWHRYNRNKLRNLAKKPEKRGDEMALRRERMRLGDILIKQNVLTEEQLKQALELQKGSAGDPLPCASFVFCPGHRHR